MIGCVITLLLWVNCAQLLRPRWHIMPVHFSWNIHYGKVWWWLKWTFGDEWLFVCVLAGLCTNDTCLHFWLFVCATQGSENYLVLQYILKFVQWDVSKNCHGNLILFLIWIHVVLRNRFKKYVKFITTNI